MPSKVPSLISLRSTPARRDTKTFDVYCHTSPSGKRYVGITCMGMRRRWCCHVSVARRGSMLPLHCAIRKYGSLAFAHEVIAAGLTQEQAEATESEWIAGLACRAPRGYNLTDGGDGVRNPDREIRIRIGSANRGRALSDEHRAKIGAGGRGLKRSATTRSRIGDAVRGRVMTAATRAKISRTKKHNGFRRRVQRAWASAEAAL